MDSHELLELCIKKGAICLPDSYPAKAGSLVFLTTSLTGCLMLFSKPEWIVTRDKLITSKDGKIYFTDVVTDKLWQKEIQNLIATGEELEVTKDRMLAISDYQIKAAKLEEAVLWVPKGKFIELWNPKHFKD
ncbi:MAG: hypothetical protein PXX77_03125 [Gallionella sp.]|nr:hypothetical protein [Gallionella sp.]